MKVWITKYCLTEGIQEVDAEVCKSTPSMITYKIDGYTQYAHGIGKDWHSTIESAIAKANDMREKKIISLQKQIVKLSKINFEIKP